MTNKVGLWDTDGYEVSTSRNGKAKKRLRGSGGGGGGPAESQP